MHQKTIFLSLYFVLFSSFMLFAQDKESKIVYEYPEPAITNHSITLNGEKINYTAKAGHLLLLNEKGEESAKVFYIAYTKDNVKDNSKRPVTFAFNGGPGSSSVWLHMGALGPKRILMNEDGSSLPPPYKVVDNEFSWLDKTDLVFIDPVQTGYSRPAEGVDKKEFTGYKEDIESVGSFIHKYITKNGRWDSPKFLAGESYGTTRAAGLSGYLQDRHGMYLNGIVMISAVMNFQTIYFSEGNDLPYSLFLPSFAAAAYHHGKVDKAKFPNFQAFLQEVKEYALTDYTVALMKGDLLTEAEEKVLSEKLNDYLGVSKNYLKNHFYRLKTWNFAKELLREEGFTIGRFDGLVKGIDKSNAGEAYDFDPSYSLTIYGGYTAAVNNHFKKELKFENEDMVYEILTSKVRPWNYGDAENKFLNNAETLRAAIHKNPHLKVLVCNGYYDLATPYFATEYTVNHMFLNEAYKDNISLTYYEGGHMMYTMLKELKKFTKDVRGFYEETLND